MIQFTLEEIRAVWYIHIGTNDILRRKEVTTVNHKIYSIDEIKSIVSPVAMRHNVGKVFLFGSYARGTASGTSDVDLCVDASKLTGLFSLGALYADLEDALEKKLDLVTVRSLQYNRDKQFVENLRREQVLIYG